jgi:acetylornithine deacetylase/succinyl-diaminopimelate desuccinylase-like protein
VTTSSTLSGIHSRPAELLQRLIQFDTTNPPGNELACIDHIDGLLREAGIATQRYAKTPERPNLLARLPGRGEAPRCCSTATSTSSPPSTSNGSIRPLAARSMTALCGGEAPST